MAKKIKHNLEDIIDKDDLSSTTEISENSKDIEQKNASASLVSVTKEEYEQLKELKTIKEQNSQLLDQKSKMTDIIAKYIEEIDKSKLQIKQLEDTNSELKKSIDKAEQQLDNLDVKALKERIAVLENENNAFNAKYGNLLQQYTSIKQQLEKNQNIASSQSKMMPRKNGGFYYQENGYGTWN